MYLCECRGPCRRSFELEHDVYRWLRTMGAVLTIECADREDRTVVHWLREKGLVVASTNGPWNAPRLRPPDSL